ncbi:hypothetical protein V8G54_023467 [Vigna mungo]|uniref:Uncharacterized protein n=1 Tax=Vigna mungo TaxID=3915 RepID=A0AAQ3N5G0_VIGMU
MKFNSPKSVTLLPLPPSSLASFLPTTSLSVSLFDNLYAFFLCSVRSREQSMSSITIIDLLVASIRSFLNYVFSFTAVCKVRFTFASCDIRVLRTPAQILRHPRPHLSINCENRFPRSILIPKTTNPQN